MLNQIVDFNVPFTLKKPVAYAVHNAFSPFGWTQHKKLFKGNVFEEIINNPVTIVTEPFKALDREVIQPLYREVIQPVGHALEVVGQGIAKDPVTFLAQVAAVAAAPFTAGQSLWALPVIAAASTAVKGGSFEQILTATAISAASAVVGGALGPGTGATGWIMNGLSTASEFGPSFAIAGNAISFSTAQTIAQVGAGLSMAAVNATGAAVQGRDPLAAAIPALVGTAAGAAVNTLASTEIFQDLGRSINDLGTNVSPVVQRAMTGVVSSAVAGAMSGKDPTGSIAGYLATGLVEGLYSTVDVVGNLFKNDAGGITKYGAATQSLIANLAGTVAATAAQSGPMGSEFSGKLTSSITSTLSSYLSAGYDALAGQVRSLYDNTSVVANKLNDAATNQQNIYTSWDNAYKSYESKYANLQSLYDRQDVLMDQYMNATTQADINRIFAELSGVQDQLRSGVAELNTLESQIDSFSSQYLESQKVTEQAQTEFYELAKELGTQSELLTSKTNEIAKAATQKVVEDLDPTFNAEEYKKINNLGSGVDAYSDWMARGKDLGLPTNLEAAQQDIQDNYTRLAKEIIQEQWGTGWEPPASMVATLKSKLYQQYGNNLQLLKDASAQNVTTAFGAVSKTLDGFLPSYNSEEAKQAILQQSINENLAPGWYQPKEFNMPDGMKFATQQDIADMMAKGTKVYTAYDDNGFSVYLKQDENYKPIQKYDSQTGEIKSMASIINTITTKDMSPTEILNYVSKASNDTLEYIVNADKAVSTTQPYSSVDTSWLVQTLKQGADVIRSAANTDSAPLLYQFMSKGLDVGAATLSGFAQVTSSATFLESMFRGVNPNDQPTMEITNYLNGMATAMRSDEMKSSIQSLNDALKTKGTDVVGAVLNNVVDNPAGMINFIGTNLVAMLPGFAAGAWVGKGASAAVELEGFAANAVQRLVGNAAVNTSRLYEIGMEAASNGLSAFNETRSLLKEKNPSWTNEQLDAEAMSRAKLVAGTAALTTIGTQVVGLDKVTQNLLGAGNPSSSAFSSILNKLVASPLSEAVGESFQSGIPQIMQEYLFKEIDPSRTFETAIGSIAGQTTLGFIAGAGTSVAIGSLQSINDIQNIAIEMNYGFDQAIKSGSSSMDSLGYVLDQWIPKPTEGSGSTFIDNIRSTIVPQILLANPNIADSYGSPAAYIDAVKNELGVYEVNLLADIAESVPKFAGQVTTSAEAKALLESKGLTGVTAEDAVAAGIVGATPQDVETRAIKYADQQMISEAEARAAAAQENYDITADDLSRLVGRGVQANVIAQFISEIDPKAVTEAEAKQYFLDQGYDKARAEDIAQFVKSAPEETMKQAVAEWVNPRQVTRAEALQFFSELGYVPSEEEITQYVVQGPEVFQDAIKTQLGEYVDPRYVDAEEVRQAFVNMGLNAPVAASDVLRLSGQYAETELAGKAKEALPIVSANSIYALLSGNSIASQQVKDEILGRIEQYKNLGMDQAAAQAAATQAVAAQLGTTKTDLLTALGATEQNLMLEISGTKTELLAKIEEYQARGMSSDEAIQAAVDTLALDLGTTRNDLLSQLGTTEAGLKTYVSEQVSATESRLADLIAKNEAAGMARSEATQAAIDDLAGQLGTTRTDLLTKIDLTSQQFQNEIEIAKTDINKQITLYQQQTGQQLADTKAEIQSQMAAYEQAGIDRDTALDLAISGVAQDLGTTKADLLTQIGSTEDALRTEFTQQTTALSTQVQDVAKLLGKPASQVTANDITMVQNMIDQQTAVDLAYDTNKDGVIDQTDLTNLQTQLEIQQNPNIQQQIDPITGLTVSVDTTTGKAVTPFYGGEQWAPTGIYAALEQQKLQSATAAAAQAKQAKEAQQKSQFGNLMNMLFQAPDAAGQQVTVKTPDPAKINYIYDWSSIFATPSQAGLMPSPYGAMNTVAPQQQAQAANQPMFKMASGFAGGGIVNSNDIQVGGSVDDLINILKGN